MRSTASPTWFLTFITGYGSAHDVFLLRSGCLASNGRFRQGVYLVEPLEGESVSPRQKKNRSEPVATKKTPHLAKAERLDLTSYT